MWSRAALDCASVEPSHARLIFVQIAAKAESSTARLYKRQAGLRGSGLLAARAFTQGAADHA
ncbi:hypothetical protein, partial [Enterobacter hormaechei]|uniref:hypothetical protein n=1 Tax=Enterobacter hormaechei TaxID=158836 RepID=UPI0020412868